MQVQGLVSELLAKRRAEPSISPGGGPILFTEKKIAQLLIKSHLGTAIHFLALITVISFGLTSAPAAFQAIMNNQPIQPTKIQHC